jgi:hypothetical protein
VEILGAVQEHIFKTARVLGEQLQTKVRKPVRHALGGFENQTVLHQTLRVLDLDGLLGLQFRILQRVAHVPLEQELGLNAKQL